jgi:hypothetical protein
MFALNEIRGLRRGQKRLKVRMARETLKHAALRAAKHNIH